MPMNGVAPAIASAMLAIFLLLISWVLGLDLSIFI